ncbi:MAG: hypothetical protein FWF44_08090 [Defluviitaleaceae bacterium]|nr:hypothetical protein [Defluviitaleaceae bacterium]
MRAFKPARIYRRTLCAAAVMAVTIACAVPAFAWLSGAGGPVYMSGDVTFTGDPGIDGSAFQGDVETNIAAASETINAAGTPDSADTCDEVEVTVITPGGGAPSAPEDEQTPEIPNGGVIEETFPGVPDITQSPETGTDADLTGGTGQAAANPGDSGQTTADPGDSGQTAAALGDSNQTDAQTAGADQPNEQSNATGDIQDIQVDNLCN